MEPLLTLDLADSPAKIRVVSYEDEKLKVWSETTVELVYNRENEQAPSTNLANQEEASTHTQSEDIKSKDDSQSDSATMPTSPAQNSSEIALTSNTPSAYFVSQLSNAISKLDPIWTSSALLIAPKSYHSLNLELPFKDDKNVNKVLSLEAQDRLPFEVDEFFIAHKVLGARPDNQYDIHVAISSKEEIGNLISDCQHAGLDPIAITTIPSLLEGRVLANPSLYALNSIFLSFHGDNAFLAVRVAGEFKSDRAFHYRGRSLIETTSEIRRSIGAAELRYSTKFEEIWLDGLKAKEEEISIAPHNTLTIESIEASLKEDIKIPVKFLLNQESNDNKLVDSFLSFYQEGKASKLFVNFRSGQFSQTLRWGALWKMTSSALPYLAIFILASFAILTATYFIREQEIESLQQGVLQKVQPLLGDTKVISGQVVKSIQIANDTIEKQLKDLGSPSKFSPLDVLSEVTKDFSSIKDISISAVNIRGTQLTVTGTSTNYENVDAIEKILQSKRTLYCRPSKQVSGTSTRQFTFTIILCD